ncbi:chaperone modulator CbpM [Niabella sp. W65]|nr:chaperone modulator CbpM [Niabella sp. W65]MCH7362972.1 chaperone modulator CbpM [Niabella sp. W65]ULT38910.1 chaperone modulator CbpM [Niabella sp. I65]
MNEYGLIELVHSGKKKYITFEQLPDIEKFIRMYYELQINIAGIDAIHHLLTRIELLQQKLKQLENASES